MTRMNRTAVLGLLALGAVLGLAAGVGVHRSTNTVATDVTATQVRSWPHGSPAGPSCRYVPANSLHPKSPPPCTDYFNAADSPISVLVPPTRYCVLVAGWPMTVSDNPVSWGSDGYSTCAST